MFCFICDREFETVSFVIFHLKNEHFLAEAHGLKLKCLASKNCKKLFSTFSSLSRHSKSCILASIESDITLKKTKNYKLTASEVTTNSLSIESDNFSCNSDFNVVNDTSCNTNNIEANYDVSVNDESVSEMPSIKNTTELQL